MTSVPVPLNLQRLRRALMPPAGSYGRVDLKTSTGSTNSDLLAVAAVESGSAEGKWWPDLSALTAEEQFAGRGRLDRTWVSQAGSSIIVSVLLRPENAGKPLPMTSYPWLSLLAAIALIEAVGDETGVKAELKWPNDVLINGRKLAGILAQLAPPSASARLPEATGVPGVPGAAAGPVVTAGPVVIVGTGVNVSQKPAELPVETATSLAIERSPMLDRNVLLPAYLARFAALYLAFCAADGDARRPLADGDSLIKRATAQMVTLGTQVRADFPGNRSVFGLAAGLDATGSLLLTDALGATHTVSAGDVVHLRPHNAGSARDSGGTGDAVGTGNSTKLPGSGVSSRYA
ncbi:biotin--[acetyl-CoA-carboxylase] ligase [Paeniglutamicibacter antarcticus]|uniref:biotin--[biotin carboxyl-carrier protein] ligase n=1 Tax=Arthrobacter terrae TaxID=2935737 RepID=A0A931CP34_9MICC|nr:biotin--[acetyl-CoA-carboxylase] ligase [Arthrobacter terrae]MBG0738391.1 biotin--[acetyl-CoA-carboxylase] ligase [Arthrobacter terrae]